jgi:hypothetical protein
MSQVQLCPHAYHMDRPVIETGFTRSDYYYYYYYCYYCHHHHLLHRRHRRTDSGMLFTMLSGLT